MVGKQLFELFGSRPFEMVINQFFKMFRNQLFELLNAAAGQSRPFAKRAGRLFEETLRRFFQKRQLAKARLWNLLTVSSSSSSTGQISPPP